MKATIQNSKKRQITPAGEIPFDWNWAPLSQVAVVQTGLSKSAGRGGSTVTMPYLRVANVQDGHFLLDEVKTIEVPSSQIDRFLLRAGDLILTEGGDADKLGRGALWDGQIAPCVHQNHLFVVRSSDARLDARFLASCTQASRGRRYFRSCSKQSTNLASINSTQLKQFPIPLPPIQEQRRISETLIVWDENLGKIDDLIAAKLRNKQGLLQQLLWGKRRLPEFKGRKEQRRLSQLVESAKRPTPKPQSAFLSAGIRSHGRGVFLKPSFKPGNIALEELYKLKEDDLVVNITFAWEGAVAIVPSEADGALVSHRFPTFRCKSGVILPRFLKHAIATKRFVFSCGSCSPGGAGRNRVLKISDFLKIAVPCPSIAEQEAIAGILDTCDEELRLLRAQRAAIDLQKRGLMERLLTGDLRVRP